MSYYVVGAIVLGWLALLGAFLLTHVAERSVAEVLRDVDASS